MIIDVSKEALQRATATGAVIKAQEYSEFRPRIAPA
jgi:hypothetical protein